jgi:hypothetical protein
VELVRGQAAAGLMLEDAIDSHQIALKNFVHVPKKHNWSVRNDTPSTAYPWRKPFLERTAIAPRPPHIYPFMQSRQARNKFVM